jgi:hypothetical protein
MIPEKFYHPLLTQIGQNIDDALQVGKNLVGTICQPNGPEYTFHAATLYKEENKFYVFKNSYPKSPQIKILASLLPYSRKI